ncbi:MAG: hypothetical protein CMM39_01805 [Rhodospirillaceae bacterium]|nr:hypothetical protein [Rhodospirillaceae bacterium]
MSFIEQAYLKIKTIDPSITTDQFSTNWLNKCSSYYRSYKASERDLTLHALMCFLENLNEKSSSLRMNNESRLLHAKAEQYDHLRDYTKTQINYLIR